MKEVPSLIGDGNGALHDYEVRYEFDVPGGIDIGPNDNRPARGRATHVVRQSKSLKNALASFARAVPEHGPIKSIRKVVPK